MLATRLLFSEASVPWFAAGQIGRFACGVTAELLGDLD
jgi:hypothetical protein